MSKARDLANASSALSAVDATELGYLDGVTSAIQTQVDAKQAVVSGVDDTEIGYLDGVTSAIQTQVDAKIPNTLTTTTGDIIYASGANTPARLAVGSTSDVLTVAGGVPTWAAPAGGTSFSGCAVKNSSAPTISNNTHTIVNYDTEIFDTDSYHSTATNTSRITIPAGKSGYYLVTARGQYGAAAGFTQLNVYKNGAEISAWSNAGTTTTGGTYMTNTGTYYLTAGDYIETDTYQNSGSSQVLDIVGNYGYFGVVYLGA